MCLIRIRLTFGKPQLDKVRLHHKTKICRCRSTFSFGETVEHTEIDRIINVHEEAERETHTEWPITFTNSIVTIAKNTVSWNRC